MGNNGSKLDETRCAQTPIRIASYDLNNLNDLKSKTELLLDEDQKSERSRVSSQKLFCLAETCSQTSLNNSENEFESQEIHILFQKNDDLQSDMSDCEEPETVKSKVFNSTKILLVNNQDIRRIRKEREAFRDPYFKPNVKMLTTSVSSELAESLLRGFDCRNTFDLSELNSKIKWERCAVISYNNRRCLKLKNEFVLNENGAPLPDNFSMYDYVNYFSIHDIFQGCLGDCFMIAAIMGITYNKELLVHVIPKDNASKRNMQLGAYHFRFWKLGDWYDVVIDDYLPVRVNYDLFFTRNLTFQNEFWIPLFEKAVAKFVGCYDILQGGILSNSSLFLSGGVHDTYFPEIATHLTKKTPIIYNNAINIFKFINEEFDNKPETVCPNVDELFEILKFASKRKDLIGCYQIRDNLADIFGVVSKHQYLVSEVDVTKDIRYVKIHNPHNRLDDIKKKYTYMKFESLLKSYGLWTTYPGEFFMTFEDFIVCFEGITVVNLLPEKEISIDSKHLGLEKKSTLFTQWKIQNARGILYPKQYTGRKRVLKFKVKVKTNKPEYMIMSLCTAYIKTVPIVSLKVYKTDGLKSPKLMRNHSTIEFGGNHQQVFRITLAPGEYILFFDQLVNRLANELDYCARVFTNSKSENDVLVNFFEEQV